MARSFAQRMIGAAKLEAGAYEEVEADTSALGQAMAVVVLVSVAAGTGSLRAGGLVGLVMAAVAALVGWFIWAGLTYIIGTRLLPEPQTEADLGELLRTTGFAASPGLLKVFGILPIIGALVGFFASVWMLIAFVVAVRQALDYTSTARAVMVCLIGWVIYLAIEWGMFLIRGAFT